MDVPLRIFAIGCWPTSTVYLPLHTLFLPSLTIPFLSWTTMRLEMIVRRFVEWYLG